MITLIPAQSGYFAVVKKDDLTLHLPVIAWRVTESEGLLTLVEVDAVGLDGLFSPDCPIYGPDGEPAHE